MARASRLSERRAWLGPTGGWSKEQCGEERESGENPRALWVASNRLKKPEVYEMDPGMTMAGPRRGAPMTKTTTTSDRTGEKDVTLQYLSHFVLYIFSRWEGQKWGTDLKQGQNTMTVNCKIA